MTSPTYSPIEVETDHWRTLSFVLIGVLSLLVVIPPLLFIAYKRMTRIQIIEEYARGYYYCHLQRSI